MTHTDRALTVAVIAAAAMLTAGCQPTPQPYNERYNNHNISANPGGNGQATLIAQNPDKPVNDRVVAGRFESLLRATAAKVAAAPDMHCVLVRREMVKGALQPLEEMDFRQRFAPQSLRLVWTGERFKGRDLLYVAGANDDMVLVKEKGGIGGLLTGGRPLRFALDSPTIVNGSRWAPDVAGYNNLITRLSQIYNEARSLSLAWVAEKPADNGARRLQTFEITLESALLKSDVSRMIITFDPSTSLAMRSVVYDAKGRLVEDYDWQGLKLNAGLTDSDFTFETR